MLKKIKAEIYSISELKDRAEYSYQEACSLEESPEEAKVYYEYLLELTQNTSLWEYQALALKWLGTYYYRKSHLDLAIDHTHKAMQFYEKNDNIDLWIGCKLNLAVYYNALGCKDKSKQFYYEILQKSPSDILTQCNLAGLLIDEKDYPQAEELLIKALHEATQTNHTLYRIEASTNLSQLYNEKNQPEKAIEYLNSIQHLFLGKENNREKAFALLNEATAYKLLGNYTKTEQLLRQCLDLADSIDNDEVRWFTYHACIDLYDLTQNYAKEKDFLLKLIKLNEKLYSTKTQQKIAELEANIEVEKRLSIANQMMEKSARLSTIGVMAAGITHEINQPLNAIMIDAEALLYKNETDNILPEGYLNRLNYIVEAAHRIEQIIKHIRSFWVKSEFIEKQPFQVNQVIIQTLHLVEQQIKSHGIFLHLDLTSQNPQVYGNAINLQQVIINLIVNSIHALDDADTDEKQILISSETDAEHCLITFKDTGNGIVPELLDHLFDPFVTTKKPDKGTGLGLALVHNFIKDLQGNIEYDDSQKGAVFNITLPLHRSNK